MTGYLLDTNVLSEFSRRGEPDTNVDIETGKNAWEIPTIGGSILASGLMATVGGPVFYGDNSGAFEYTRRKTSLAFQQARVSKQANDILTG